MILPSHLIRFRTALAHIWDASTVAALDAIETKYERLGKRVELHGLNAASVLMRERMSGQLGGEG